MLSTFNSTQDSCLAGVGALFSGLQAASLRAATYGSVRIGLCEPLQEKAGRSGGALLAGVLATVVGNPFEAGL